MERRAWTRHRSVWRNVYLDRFEILSDTRDGWPGAGWYVHDRRTGVVYDRETAPGQQPGRFNSFLAARDWVVRTWGHLDTDSRV